MVKKRNTEIALIFLSMREIKFLGTCPICNTQYNSENASLLERNAEFMSFYIDCDSCLSSVIVAVFFPLSGLVTTVGMLTDFSRDDVKKLRKFNPITLDEVLDLHVYIESISGGANIGNKSKNHQG